MGVATIENRFSSFQDREPVSHPANWNRALFLPAIVASGAAERRMAIGNYTFLLVQTQRPLV